MRNKKSIFTLVVLLSLAGIIASIAYVMAQPDNDKPVLQLVDTKALTAMIEKGEDMVIVDLREPELYAAGRVPGAINIPFAEFRSRYSELPKDKKIVFVCHTGRMGTDSGNFVLEKGYKQVYNLEGGMAKWTGKLEK